MPIQLYKTSLRDRVICVQNRTHFLGRNIPGLLQPEQDGITYESLASLFNSEIRPPSDRTSLTLLQTQKVQREFGNNVQRKV